MNSTMVNPLCGKTIRIAVQIVLMVCSLIFANDNEDSQIQNSTDCPQFGIATETTYQEQSAVRSKYYPKNMQIDGHLRMFQVLTIPNSTYSIDKYLPELRRQQKLIEDQFSKSGIPQLYPCVANEIRLKFSKTFDAYVDTLVPSLISRGSSIFEDMGKTVQIVSDLDALASFMDRDKNSRSDALISEMRNIQKMVEDISTKDEVIVSIEESIKSCSHRQNNEDKQECYRTLNSEIETAQTKMAYRVDMAESNETYKRYLELVGEKESNWESIKQSATGNTSDTKFEDIAEQYKNLFGIIGAQKYPNEEAQLLGVDEFIKSANECDTTKFSREQNDSLKALINKAKLRHDKLSEGVSAIADQADFKSQRKAVMKPFLWCYGIASLLLLLLSFSRSRYNATLKPVTTMIEAMEVTNSKGTLRTIKNDVAIRDAYFLLVVPYLLSLGLVLLAMEGGHKIGVSIWVSAGLTSLIGLTIAHLFNLNFVSKYIARVSEGIVISTKHGVFSLPFAKDNESFTDYLLLWGIRAKTKIEVLQLDDIVEIHKDRLIQRQVYTKNNRRRVHLRTFYRFYIIGEFGTRSLVFGTKLQRDEAYAMLKQATGSVNDNDGDENDD